jgi:hypothetical protein
MIPIPNGWELHQAADEVLAVHPGGLVSGAIRYRERIAPLAPLTELIASALADAPDFEAEEVSPAKRVITTEGEYAALVTADGLAGQAPARLFLGFVFHDHSFNRLSSLCVDPARFNAIGGLVAELARADTALRGERPRRSLYRPPTGWLGVARGLLTEWYPPAFPREQAMITVWPAMPREHLPSRWWSAALERAPAFVRDGGPESMTTPRGLAGWCVRAVREQRGAAVERVLAVLDDGHYAHLCRLEKPVGDGGERAAFDVLVESIEPIPTARTSAKQLEQAFEHWTC